MKNQYKDIRSVKTWLKKLEETSIRNDKVTFCTFTSLTPENIAKEIREHYIDPDDPSLPVWIKQHYTKYNQVITPKDADDKRLISIILFIINHILESKYFARQSYDKATDAVRVSVEVLRTLNNDGSYISHIVAVCRAAEVLALISEKDTGFYQSSKTKITTGKNRTIHSRSFMIHPSHLRNPSNFLETVECPDPLIAKNVRKHVDEENTLHYQFKEIRKNKVRVMSYFYAYHLRADYDAALADLKVRHDEEMAQLHKQKTNKYAPNVETVDTVQLRYFASVLALQRMCSDNVYEKFLKTDKNGRIHSNLTSFPSVLRKHLSFIGCNEPMAMVDMANTQPFLLILLVMERLTQESSKKIDTRKKLEKYCREKDYQDVMKYANIVENGAIYKECYRLLMGNKKLKEITPAWKELVRNMIYTSLLFGDGYTKWHAAKKLRARFKREYPTIYRIINHYRTPDYKNLPNRLQKEESKLFIDDILTKLIVREKRPFILSLHDSIYCPESEIPSVISKFEHAFSKSQFQVKLKVDKYAVGKTDVIIINRH
jgi:hypothetical protein